MLYTEPARGLGDPKEDGCGPKVIEKKHDLGGLGMVVALNDLFILMAGSGCAHWSSH